LNNCPIKINQDMCYISVRWLLTSNQTGINIRSDVEKVKKSSSSSELLLTVAADFGGLGPNQYLEHSFNYFCSTDKCNDINTFKRLLQSVIITDQFIDLKDLLEPVKPFDGHWCFMFSNQIASEYDTEVIQLIQSIVNNVQHNLFMIQKKVKCVQVVSQLILIRSH